MRTKICTIAVMFVVFAGLSHQSSAQSCPLQGTPGSASSGDWAAAWLDLREVQDFSADQRLCLHINGSRYVLVRLLPEGEDPGNPVGIDNGQYTVPDSGALEITLEDDHPDTVQISVHGFKRAWDHVFPEGNGKPKLKRVCLLAGNDVCQ